MTTAPRSRIALRTVALGYLLVLLARADLAMILYRTFEDGLVAFFESITHPGGHRGASTCR